MRPYVPWIVLTLGILEMTLKTITKFTDPEALQLAVDLLCLFLLGVTAVMYSLQRPEAGRRGRS